MMLETELSPKENTNSTSAVQNRLSLLINESTKFSILFAFAVPSFTCYTFLIIYMLSQKSHRSAPHNYCLLIVLNLQYFCNIVDIPSQMYFYRRGRVLFESGIYCYVWQFVAYSTWPNSVILLAWTSFERHILIFHDRLVRSKWANICLHYAPPILIIAYVMCFYLYAFIFYTCKVPYLFQQNYCNTACYTSNASIMLWSRVANYMVPSFLTVVFSVSLLIRVIYSKRRLQQTFIWRKHKKMTYQLLSISFLSIATVFPYSVARFLSYLGSNIVSKQVLELCTFISIFEPLCFPFVYLASVSEIWTMIRTKLRRKTAPITLDHN